MTTSVCVILNPFTHGGKGERLVPAIEEGLRERDFDFALHRTEGAGHAVELAAGAVASGAERVLVVGGDGTIHEVANGLLSSSSRPPPAIAVLPVGTGNDFHRMVGADRSIEGALGLLEGGTVVPFDVGRATWDDGSRYFVNLVGVGIDVAILKRRHFFSRLPGKLQYLAALASGLVDFSAMEVHVDLEGLPSLDCRALLAAVTVGPSVAGGIPLTPHASPFDGVLDFCLVERLHLGKILYYLPKVLRGTHGMLPAVHLHQVKGMRFVLQNGENFFFQMDGELEGSTASWLEVKPADAHLPVLVPEPVARQRERGLKAGEGAGGGREEAE